MLPNVYNMTTPARGISATPSSFSLCKASIRQYHKIMATLRVVKGNDTGKESEITHTNFTMGRGKNVDFYLNDPSISRLHAAIYNEADSFSIEDQNSNNGLFLNQIKKTLSPIKDGDVITSFNGLPLSAVEDLTALVRSMRRGDEATIEVVRGEQTLRMEVTLPGH